MKVKILRYFIFGTAFLFIAYIVYLAVPRMIEMGKRMYYSNPENVENEMLKYLNERYGEEFESEYMAEPSFAYNYYRMTAYPKENKDDTFEVEAHKYGNSKFHYFDSYYGIKITKEYEEYVRNIINDFFPIFKCYIDFSKDVFPEDFDVKTKLSDLLIYEFKDRSPYPYIDVCIPSNVYKKNKVSQVINKLAEQKVRGSINIVEIKDTAFSKITQYNWNDEIKNDDYESNIYFIDYNYKVH